MRTFYTDAEIFVDWCEKVGLEPFPASVATLCHFLEEQAQDRAPSTVRRRLYSIRKAHRLLCLSQVSFAHSEEDVDRYLDVAEEFMATLLKN